jgi:hypothetical protein
MVPWFVGDEDENPTGFDSSYYKSPHFGLEILLNKVFTVDSTNYLWRTTYLSNFDDLVNEVRPVHTVPHFSLKLNPKTDEFGNIIESDGDVNCKAFGNWNPSIKYFDEQDSDEQWSFDDGTYFDQSATTFINSITKWVLGTGNYPCSLGDSDFDIETPALNGTIDDTTIYDDRVVFEFTVEKATVQSGITELGLYVPGAPDTLVVAACFPKIDKGSDTELTVQVEVYREPLA